MFPKNMFMINKDLILPEMPTILTVEIKAIIIV